MQKKLEFSREMPSILIILAVGLALSWRLIFDGYLFTEDADEHLLWAQQFLKGLMSGNLYPRWAGDANAGWGNPAFVFFPPFIFYTYAAISLFTKDVAAMMSASAVAGLIGSGLAMYVLGRSLLGRAGSAFASVLYMALPWHLINIYYRTAMAEFWAFFWLPLILFFASRLGRSGKGSFIGLSVCYAGLITTHLPTALLFTPFLLAFIAFIFVGQRDMRSLGLRLLALGAGTALSAVFLLPAVMELRHIDMQDFTSEELAVRSNFLFSTKAIESGAFKGIEWLLRAYERMALASLLVFLIGAVSSSKRISGEGPLRAPLRFFAFSGMAAVFMTTPLSLPVWEALAPFHFDKVQFPVRMLTTAGLFAALSAGGTLHFIGSAHRRKTALSLALLTALLVNAVLAGEVLRNFRGFDRSKLSVTADMSVEMLRKEFAKFRPSGNQLNNVWGYIPSSLKFIPTGDWPDVVLRGSGKIEVLGWKPEDRLLRVDVPEGGEVLLKTFYFPGWKAYAGGRPIELRAEPTSGQISFSLPPGLHEVTIRYEGGPWQKAGKFVSMAAMVFLAGYCLLGKLRYNFLHGKTIS